MTHDYRSLVIATFIVSWAVTGLSRADDAALESPFDSAEAATPTEEYSPVPAPAPAPPTTPMAPMTPPEPTPAEPFEAVDPLTVPPAPPVAPTASAVPHANPHIAEPVPVYAGDGAYVNSGVCSECNNPNCRRSRHPGGCCDLIRATLYEHFGRGAPGYCYTPVPPVGARLHAIRDWQISNGQAAMQVLYHYDFVDGDPRLSIRGREQLLKISARAYHNDHPIIIEPLPYQPELERMRWEEVTRMISELSLPISPARVIVANPPSRAAEGEEIPIIYTGFLGLRNLRSGGGGMGGGMSMGGGGGMSGGMGAAPIGGGR